MNCVPLAPQLARASRLALAAAVLAGFACRQESASPTSSSAPPPAELRVAAAASLKELLESTRPRFEAAHAPLKIVVSLEASSTLSRQIEAGAEYDCFLSADAANVDRLGAHVAAGTRTEFLRNELVVVARADLASPPADATALVALQGRLALAGEAVPAGKYARTWLTKKGLLEKLQPKIVSADNVRATLALVESDAVDAAIVYATDARQAKKAKLAFAVPRSEDPGVVYVACAVAGSKAPLAAEYVKWLRAEEFQVAALVFGFLPIDLERAR